MCTFVAEYTPPTKGNKPPLYGLGASTSFCIRCMALYICMLLNNCNLGLRNTVYTVI